MKDEISDVPDQYKRKVDYYIRAIMHGVEDLMAIGEELGCTNMEIAGDKYIVVIKR